MRLGKPCIRPCLSLNPFHHFHETFCLTLSSGGGSSDCITLDIPIVNDFEKNRSYIPLQFWEKAELTRITHLDLSGLQQLNDFVFGFLYLSNVDLKNLKCIDCSGCNYVTDTGLRFSNWNLKMSYFALKSAPIRIKACGYLTILMISHHVKKSLCSNL